MPTIHHIGIYCDGLDSMLEFYRKYFGAKAGEKYSNPSKGFESYSLSFGSGRRCAIELMRKDSVSGRAAQPALGLTHIAICVGSEKAVDKITERLRSDGYKIISEPRKTGDGFYESMVVDPEGNNVEITA